MQQDISYNGIKLRKTWFLTFSFNILSFLYNFELHIALINQRNSNLQFRETIRELKA